LLLLFYRLAYSQYALGGYNTNNLEQILGLFKGCINSQAPFILQISKGARSYADNRMLEANIRTAKEIYLRGGLRCIWITATKFL
jgi:fructose-bisphosphate aldolase class II